MSDKITHTPGPWEVVNFENRPNLLIMAENKDTLIASINWPGMRSLAVLHSNAKLIAAAPDMAEVLVRLQEWFVGEYGDEQISIREVLQKAGVLT